MASDRPVVFDDDNPEWTEDDFARAKSPGELPAHVAAAFPQTKNRGGRPKGTLTSDRQQVSLRIPNPVLEHFRSGGPGWQTRMVATLEREAFLRSLDPEAQVEMYEMAALERPEARDTLFAGSLRNAVRLWNDGPLERRQAIGVRFVGAGQDKPPSLYPDTIAALSVLLN